MKKLFLLTVSGIIFMSCDFILKERNDDEVELDKDKKVVLGTDKDENGCVTSAGYKWSQIQNECVRIFEEGYRLNTIEELKEEGAAKSAFVIFEENGDRAELFLPGAEKSLILKREKKDGPYTNKEWLLQSGSGYTLKKSGKIMFAGAAIEEQRVTGDDTIES